MSHPHQTSDLASVPEISDPFDIGFMAPDAWNVGAAATGASGGMAPGMALYLTEAGNGAAIDVADLHQGQIGDCFLISSIGELALTKSVDISNMIHTNADGTETVTLYGDRTGHAIGWGTTALKAVSVTVSNVFPNYAVDNGATQDVVGGVKEIWPAVLEKAVATLDGGYGSIANGGSPVLAMETLTGRAATFMSPAKLTLAVLQSDIAANDMITFDTFAKGGLPNNLVGGHAYMFEKLVVTNGVAAVQLGNPWGFNQPSLIPLSQITNSFAEIDIGHPT